MRKKGIFNNPILKTIFNIISWILIGILVLVAAVLIYYLISSKLYESRGEKFEPEFSLYTIISPSMEPNINIYDVVFTRKIKDPSTLKEGDVITFISTSTISEGSTVTHRIKSVIKTDDDIKFRTQGDNNPVADSALVESNNLLGKVVFKIPQLGRIQFLLQSKGGLLVVLLIPAIIVVTLDIIKVLRLSNTKKVLDESLNKSEEENRLFREKEEKLKEELQQKYNNKNMEYQYQNMNNVSPQVNQNINQYPQNNNNNTQINPQDINLIEERLKNIKEEIDKEMELPRKK